MSITSVITESVVVQQAVQQQVIKEGDSGLTEGHFSGKRTMRTMVVRAHVVSSVAEAVPSVQLYRV